MRRGENRKRTEREREAGQTERLMLSPPGRSAPTHPEVWLMHSQSVALYSPPRSRMVGAFRARLHTAVLKAIRHFGDPPKQQLLTSWGQIS